MLRDYKGLDTPILLAIDPDGTYPIVPARYAAATNPPTFIFRFGSDAERGKVRSAFLAVPFNESDPEPEREAHAAAIRAFLVGWQNVRGPGGPIPYEPAKIREILLESELNELSREMWRCSVLSEEAKKNSESTPASNAGSSAPTAAVPAK